ncbi:hypothetical protein [Glycomyces buryatensis]|uniref:Uncharacterized protein n=1 Tax=Glycomyces buryatensis TaxID=2570927 RepID=A0A4S8QFG6_9ACTN|nr:hypothetical protein [Glycomyces buryatensis]THV42411.1 hypothetical protein FAB82_07090 [Glycomyces buryatensis]
MPVTVPSADQILGETASQMREIAADPHFRGDPVATGLSRSMVTAASTTHSIEATMSLDLKLSNIRLPHDIARSVSFCEEVSAEAGVVLTELHAACARARTKILAAVRGEGKR